MSFEQSALQVNLYKSERRLFDKLLAEYHALFNGRTYEQVLADRDNEALRRIRAKLDQLIRLLNDHDPEAINHFHPYSLRRKAILCVEINEGLPEAQKLHPEDVVRELLPGIYEYVDESMSYQTYKCRVALLERELLEIHAEKWPTNEWFVVKDDTIAKVREQFLRQLFQKAFPDRVKDSQRLPIVARAAAIKNFFTKKSGSGQGSIKEPPKMSLHWWGEGLTSALRKAIQNTDPKISDREIELMFAAAYRNGRQLAKKAVSVEQALAKFDELVTTTRKALVDLGPPGNQYNLSKEYVQLILNSAEKGFVTHLMERAYPQDPENVPLDLFSDQMEFFDKPQVQELADEHLCYWREDLDRNERAKLAIRIFKHLDGTLLTRVDKDFSRWVGEAQKNQLLDKNYEPIIK